MRSQVIPAQITTVEDRIAGNLSLTQIMILMFPVFFTVALYALFAPRLQFSFYKIPLVVFVVLLCLILSLRIKGKVIFNWLVVILRYNLRPKFYVFNKNDNYLRTVDLPTFNKKHKPLFGANKVKKQQEKPKSSFSIGELVRLEGLFANPKTSFSFKSTKKGGLSVAFEQEGK